jgi:hypothetical protein
MKLNMNANTKIQMQPIVTKSRRKRIGRECTLEPFALSALPTVSELQGDLFRVNGSRIRCTKAAVMVICRGHTLLKPELTT